MAATMGRKMRAGTKTKPPVSPAAQVGDSTIKTMEPIKGYIRVRPFVEEEESIAEAEGIKLKPAFTRVSQSEIVIDGLEFQVDGVVWAIPPTQAPSPSADVSFEGGFDGAFQRTASTVTGCVVGGRNAAICALGFSNTGRSRSIWGDLVSLKAGRATQRELEQASVVLEDEKDVALQHAGIGIRAAVAVIQKLACKATESVATRNIDVSVSLFEVLQEKVRDLLAPGVEGADFRGVAVRNHPASGPYLEDVTRVKIQSVTEFIDTVVPALVKQQQNTVPGVSHIIMRLDVSQTDVVESVHALRLSHLTVVDVAALGTHTSGAPSISNLRKVIDAVGGNQSNKRQQTIPYRESVLTALLQDAIGGNCQTVALGCVSPHFAHNEETINTLRLISKLRGIQNTQRANGNIVSNIMMDMKDEIEKLHKLLDVSSGSSRNELEEQLSAKEKDFSELQAATNRAVERYEKVQEELKAQTLRSEELQKLNEAIQSEALESQQNLKMEKQKAFATAFKNAFLVGKQTIERKVQEGEMAHQIRSLKDQLEKNKILLSATKGERDRLKFENLKLDKDLRRMKVELAAARSQADRLLKDLNKAEDEKEELTTKLNLAKFEATNESHELREMILSLERQRDTLVFQLDTKEKELRASKEDQDKAIVDAVAVVKTELRAEKQACKREAERVEALRRELSKARDENDVHLKTIHRMESEQAETHEAFNARISLLEHHRSEDVRHLHTVKEGHAVEREGYMKLLAEGLSITQELKNAEALFISRPTLYRSGWPGVVAWLQSIGAESLASAFQRAGFEDMYAVAAMKEEDLIAMKALHGTRRKVLAAIDDVKRQQAAATGMRTRNDGQSTTTVRAMLEDLYGWFNDFQVAIEAEAEAVPAQPNPVTS